MDDQSHRAATLTERLQLTHMRINLVLLLAGSILCSPLTSAARATDYLNKPVEWFNSEEARSLGENIISWQNEDGDWPKNTDTLIAARTGQPLSGTFDNGATTGELRFLGKIYNATAEAKYKRAFDKGLELILKAQYPNGGWPQSYPPPTGYGRHITFNDDSFIRLAEFMRDVATAAEFKFVAQPVRDRAERAFKQSIECLLRTQIKVDGERTVWCAQHDEITLEPRPARTYELVSLSGAESAKILLFLMSLENPPAEVREAIRSGVKWFEKAKLTGVRYVRENGERKLMGDVGAAPLWARFYEIGTNRPMFSGRDGVKRYSVQEIEAERRNGYAWYGDWGKGVLDRYSSWRKTKE